MKRTNFVIFYVTGHSCQQGIPERISLEIPENLEQTTRSCQVRGVER